MAGQVVKRLLHCCRGLSDAIQVCSQRPYVVNNICYIYHSQIYNKKVQVFFSRLWWWLMQCNDEPLLMRVKTKVKIKNQRGLIIDSDCFNLSQSNHPMKRTIAVFVNPLNFQTIALILMLLCVRGESIFHFSLPVNLRGAFEPKLRVIFTSLSGKCRETIGD